MAQAQPQEREIENESTFIEKETPKQKETKATKPSHSSGNTTTNTNTKSSNGSSTGVNDHVVPFKFNVQAPEFVPRSHPRAPVNANTTTNNQNQMPVSGYFYPWFNYLGVGPDWFLLGDHQDPASAAAFFMSNTNLEISDGCSTKNNVLTDDLRQKIIKQVEYQFSDMSLLANESMSRHISKDPEGYVPISVIASTKKMKSLFSNINLLTQALHSSSKLVVSGDGKKVKRRVPFSDKEREELQFRTVVVENLPEDHSHQNLEKIFTVVGSVKTIRICHPQDCNSSRSKSDFFVSNKIHALVELESPEMAEKAVEKLNDETNWRKGLRVRLLLRCSPKSVLKSRRSEFDGILEDEEDQVPESAEDSPRQNNAESGTDGNVEDNSVASKKGWAKGRGKGKCRCQNHGGRGLLAPSPQSAASTLQCEATGKPLSKGPRMPDGTKGFTMGRGKPLGSPTPASPVGE